MVSFDPQLHAALAAVLEQGDIPDALLEAKWILEDAPDAQTAMQIAERRAQHEPLQYLLGAWEFYGMRFLVGRGVLIPRADTETLVDAVLQRYRSGSALRILDLCTGSGCIALALAKSLPGADVTGLELDDTALSYARKNNALHGLSVTLQQADVRDPAVAAAYQNVDIIVSNPPYLTADDMAHLQPEVAHEPALALDGGADGLDFYRAIAAGWKAALRPGGLLALEVGIHQAEAVSELLAQHGFSQVEIIRDLCGVERVVMGRSTNSEQLI